MGHGAFSVTLELDSQGRALRDGEGGEGHLDLPQDLILLRHREKQTVALTQHWAAHTERKKCILFRHHEKQTVTLL